MRSSKLNHHLNSGHPKSVRTLKEVAHWFAVQKTAPARWRDKGAPLQHPPYKLNDVARWMKRHRVHWLTHLSTLKRGRAPKAAKLKRGHPDDVQTLEEIARWFGVKVSSIHKWRKLGAPIAARGPFELRAIGD